ncbi:MAG: type 2 lanthipeptide synthetase LanM family protein [Actinomadura sp.]
MSSPASGSGRETDETDTVGIAWRRAAWPGEPQDTPPAWHGRFRDAWDRSRAGDIPSGDLPDDLGLAEVARPLLTAAQDRLRTRLTGLTGSVGSDGVPPNLAELLCREPPLMWLGMAVSRTVAAELAAAADAGLLTGATPQERHRDFIRTLADPDTALAIWRGHPVLARYVTELLDDWVAARSAFAGDLVADLPDLGRTFSADGLGALEEVRFGAAETHRHGRGVALVRFAGATVVYKPRSLAIDRCFDRLLGRFNDSAPRYVLRRTRLLDRADHGWSEYIGPAPCARRELPAYFWRIGALLAFTHLLHGYDLHADNVIAAGANPVVVDLEALFHTEDTRPMLERVRLGDPAAAGLAESVIVTGLLPGPIVMPDVENGRPFGVDFSPLGIAPDRRSLIPIPIAEDQGTDRLRIRLGYQTVPAPAGRLRGENGETVDPRRYRDELVAGYTFGYEWLRAAGERLTAELNECADVPGRLIQLSTFLYVRLLLDSWQPAALRDAAVRERGLARLEVGWPGVPHRSALVAAELAALRRGEVPTFEVRPGHRDVWLEDGTRLRDVLGRPPLDAVRERHARMGPDDLAAQVAIIDASLATLTAPPDPHSAGPPAPRPAAVPSRDALVDQAERIATRLRESAVHSGDRIGWLTLEVVDARSRRVAPAGLDLYGGLPGIGLFLTHLAHVTGRGWIEELAARVAEEVAERCRAAAALDLAPRGTTAGVLGPLLGPVYYLAHAADVHRDAGHAELARDMLLPAVPRALGQSAAEDVAEGAAGAVFALLALHAVLPDDRILTMARIAGDRLLSAGVTEAGFGYGASGAAVALTRLYAVAPDPRYAEAARMLIAKEVRPGRDTGWCQGAAGVGISRLELVSSPVFAGQRRDLRRSLDRMAEIVRTAPAAPDDSLCHGRFARLELLATLDDGDAALPDLPVEPVWRTALPDPAPGLLAGLAGIGFGLLRLARPDAVPSVLGFRPPGRP